MAIARLQLLIARMKVAGSWAPSSPPMLSPQLLSQLALFLRPFWLLSVAQPSQLSQPQPSQLSQLSQPLPSQPLPSRPLPSRQLLSVTQMLSQLLLPFCLQPPCLLPPSFPLLLCQQLPFSLDEQVKQPSQLPN